MLGARRDWEFVVGSFGRRRRQGAKRRDTESAEKREDTDQAIRRSHEKKVPSVDGWALQDWAQVDVGEGRFVV
jgi:hypothetical protein